MAAPEKNAQLNVRLPRATMLVALRQSAKRNQISLNAEVVGRLAISLSGDPIEDRLRRIERLLREVCAAAPQHGGRR